MHGHLQGRHQPQRPLEHGAPALEALELSGRSVLVTGAHGLLGFWLTRALLEGGARVCALKHPAVGRSALALDGLESELALVHGELVDGPLLGRALREHDVQTVFHLAAQTIVGVARDDPAATFDANIRGTWTLLEACRANEVPQTIVAASDKAYGDHDTLPYREDFALQPRYPYDVSKAATDLIARSYWHTYGLPVAVTRLANLYGGGDLHGSRLVPETVAAALAGRPPVIRSDGSPQRDFLYVEDAAAAYLAVAAAVADGAGAGEAFNAGGDAPHTVLEVVELICRVAGSDVRPDIRGRGVPAAEIERQYVDSSKLRELTGWRPLVGLEDGLERTVRWYRERPQALPVV